LAEQIAHKIGGGTSQLNPLYETERRGSPLGRVPPGLLTVSSVKQRIWLSIACKKDAQL